VGADDRLIVTGRHASSNIVTSSPTELSAGMSDVSFPHSFYSLLGVGLLGPQSVEVVARSIDPSYGFLTGSQ